jgi:hypothetical protein
VAAWRRRAVGEGVQLIMLQTWRGTTAFERGPKDWSRSRRASFAGLCPICEGSWLIPLPAQFVSPIALSRCMGTGSGRRDFGGRSRRAADRSGALTAEQQPDRLQSWTSG